MAWAGKDGEIRDELKIALSKTRCALYKSVTDLERLAAQVRHPEKGPQLVKSVENLKGSLDRIEFELNR